MRVRRSVGTPWPGRHRAPRVSSDVGASWARWSRRSTTPSPGGGGSSSWRASRGSGRAAWPTSSPASPGSGGPRCSGAAAGRPAARRPTGPGSRRCGRPFADSRRRSGARRSLTGPPTCPSSCRGRAEWTAPSPRATRSKRASCSSRPPWRSSTPRLGSGPWSWSWTTSTPPTGRPCSSCGSSPGRSPRAASSSSGRSATSRSARTTPSPGTWPSSAGPPARFG
jgi:hypothetical protein